MRCGSLTPASCLQRYALTFLLQQRRCFTSFMNDFMSAAFLRISELTDAHLLPLGERHITELRRPYPRRVSMQENLSERLALQRCLRAHLVPVQIVVSKNKQYVDIFWPQTALVAIYNEKLAKQTITNKVDGWKSKDAVGDTTAERFDNVCCDSYQEKPTERHRSRLLAEFLRVYSPSTDVIGADALIYGCRGITITDVIPVGNYAIRIVFSDGHSGGLYPYEYLFYLDRRRYTLMREYIRRLKAKKKTRDAPKRAPSRRFSRGQDTLENTRRLRGSSK